jgi:hypothetical protein
MPTRKLRDIPLTHVEIARFLAAPFQYAAAMLSTKLAATLSEGGSPPPALPPTPTSAVTEAARGMEAIATSGGRMLLEIAPTIVREIEASGANGDLCGPTSVPISARFV